MPAMIVRCAVLDYNVWQSIFAAHAMARRANGSLGGRMFRGADDPNDILILLEWDNLDRARLFADSDDLYETMERAGVIGPPDIWILGDGDGVPV